MDRNKNGYLSTKWRTNQKILSFSFGSLFVSPGIAHIIINWNENTQYFLYILLLAFFNYYLALYYIKYFNYFYLFSSSG